MKTTRHSLLAKGLLVLLSLLILIFIFTYSWYADPDTPVSASGLSLSTRNTTTEFEYAIGFSTSQTFNEYKHTEFAWDASTVLNLNELHPSDALTTDINLLYDYKPSDVTGDGVTLIRPAMKYGNWSINYASRNYSTARDNEQYISFDLIFRTHVPDTVIRLDKDSFAIAACESYSGDYNSLRTPTTEKKSKYGNFSVDAIVGAVRVAFLNYEANSQQTITAGNIVSSDLVNAGIAHYAETPALLWIPRPDIYLNNYNDTDYSGAERDREKQTSGWLLDTGVGRLDLKNLQSESQTNPTYSTYTHQYYNVFTPQILADSNSTPSIVSMTGDNVIASTYDSTVSGNNNKVTFDNTCDLVSLDYYEDTDNDGEVSSGDYYYGKVRVRIWLEGTDSEARRALAGGEFAISFHITG